MSRTRNTMAKKNAVGLQVFALRSGPDFNVLFSTYYYSSFKECYTLNTVLCGYVEL